MNEESLRALLDAVRQGQTSTDDALDRLRRLPFDDLGFAHLDSHRALRAGFPEVVLCAGKRTDHVVAIMARLAEGPGPVLATRAAPEVFAAVRAAVPAARYHDLARAIVYEPQPLPRRPGRILVISAGTADLPVAEEAAVTAELMGNAVDRLYDVGVAGLHRLLAHLDQLRRPTS